MRFPSKIGKIGSLIISRAQDNVLRIYACSIVSVGDGSFASEKQK